MTPRLFGAVLGIEFALLVAVRLPQLLDPELVLDGDEAVVGLMAMHLLEGRGVPVVFYGQAYGLAFFETAAAALFFQLAGPSALALKWSQLAFWSLGWTAHVMAARRLAGAATAAILGLVLLTTPAWGAWSMMARGGYGTAFVLSGCGLWLFARLETRERGSTWEFAALGACSALVGLAQPIWLLAFAPFALAALWKHRRLGPVLAVTGGGIVSAGVVALFAGELSAYWTPKVLEPSAILRNLRVLPERLWVMFSGVYYYHYPSPERGTFTRISATLWTLGFAASFAPAVTLLKKRLPPPTFLAYALGVGLVVAFNLILWGSAAHRYLLPAASFCAFSLAVAVGLARTAGDARLLRRAGLAAALLVTVTGTAALYEFRDQSRFGDLPDAVPSRSVREALRYELEQRGVSHVYCLNATFQWNLMFESEERILARWTHPRDRYPAYPLAVDRARAAGEPVALVGGWHQLDELRPRLGGMDVAVERVARDFFLIMNPSVALLHDAGFELNDTSHLSSAAMTDSRSAPQ